MKKLLSLITCATLSLGNSYAAGEWSSPPSELTTVTSAAPPMIHANSSGQAVAVWVEPDAALANNVIKASYYNGSSWSEEAITLSDVALTQPPTAPQVSINENGEAMAIWLQSDGTRMQVYAAFSSDQGANWAPVMVSAADPTHTVYGGDFPQVSLNSDGIAVAVWTQMNGGDYQIMTSRYDPTGSTWSTPVLVEDSSITSLTKPQVFLNRDGNAVAVYIQDSGLPSGIIRASYYDASAMVPGWAVAPLPGQDSGVNADSPLLTISPNNVDSILAAWTSATLGQITTAKFDLGPEVFEWTTPNYIDISDMYNIYALSCARNAESGVCLVVSQTNAVSNPILGSISTDDGESWPTSPILSTASLPAPQLYVAVNGSGTGVTSWTEWEMMADLVKASIFTVATSWQDASTLSEIGLSATHPQVAMAGSKPLAVWADNSGASIKASEFNIAPPASISGKIVTDRFATQADRVKIISWTASPTEGVTSYTVSRNGVVIATVSASSPLSYEDHNQGKEASVYTVVAVDSIGDSTAQTITL